MNDAVNAWMPIYWGDYLRDTAHLSAAEHGAYLLMIGHYWTTGAPLPDDDDKLRRIARMERVEWKKAKGTLSGFFVIVDGFWKHKRIDAELDQWSARKERNKTRASIAASKRWGHVEASKPDARSMLEASPEQCSGDALHHSPSQIHSTTKRSDTSPIEPAEGAAAVVKAFLAARNERWPDAMPPNHSATQREHAKVILGTPGATVELVCELVRDAVAAWTDPNPPGGVGAFRQSIPNRIAQHIRASAQLQRYPNRQADSAAEHVVIDRWSRERQRLRSYRASGRWESSWDHPPTSERCQIPKSIIREELGEDFVLQHHGAAA